MLFFHNHLCSSTNRAVSHTVTHVVCKSILQLLVYICHTLELWNIHHVFVLCFPVFLFISLVLHFTLCHSHAILSLCHLHAIKLHWLPINPAFCRTSAVESRNSFCYFMLNGSVWSSPCFVAVDGVSRRWRLVYLDGCFACLKQQKACLFCFNKIVCHDIVSTCDYFSACACVFSFDALFDVCKAISFFASKKWHWI